MSAIFSLMLLWYFGSSSLRLTAWVTSTTPTPPTAVSASSTTTTTASTRGTRRRCIAETTGESRNVIRMARATGMRTIWAQYRQATTSTETSSRCSGPTTLELICALRLHVTRQAPYSAGPMDLLARHAEAHPDRPALIEGERRLSWREYHE